MQYSEYMDDAQRFGDGPQVVQTLIDTQGIAQAVPQIAAGEVFHRQVQMARLGAEIMDLCDRAMTDAGNYLVFSLETLRVIEFSLGFAAIHDFEHHVAPQTCAAREKDLREIAGGDVLHNGVAGHRNARVLRAWVGDGLSRLCD